MCSFGALAEGLERALSRAEDLPIEPTASDYMKLTCTINGQPAELEFADGDLVRGAFKRKEAAKYLAIGLTKLNTLRESGKVTPTSSGTYTTAALDRHLSAAMER